MAAKGKSGWNPARRNKKIGTSDQGFKNRNDFGIPSSWHDTRVFWEKLQDPKALHCKLGDHEFTIFVEAPLNEFKHFVSIDDLLTVLKAIPERHRTDIKTFIFRQPKRKEIIFNPCWGRMAYWADFGRYTSVSVILEAQPIGLKYKIDKNLTPDHAIEIKKLQKEGCSINVTKRHIEIVSSPESIRYRQLYRTLIHEVGHYVDYLEKVILSAKDNIDYEMKLMDLYDTRPTAEKEHFAERYAGKMSEKMKERGIIPFDSIPISKEKYPDINPDWFYQHKQNALTR